MKALVRNPGIGSPVLFPNEKLKGMRSWPVPGFENIRVYYLDRDGTLRIVRVLHGRRDLKRILKGGDPFRD